MYNEQIKQAIREKRKLQFIYQNKNRVVDPHVFGVTAKNNEVILCWQTGGSSSRPNDLPNWRMFETNKISQLQILNENFIPQSHRHNAFESDIKTVYALISKVNHG